MALSADAREARPAACTGSRPRRAVLIPCLNEELTVGQVVDDFRAALPGADVLVFDNGSSDATARVAREHGATVVFSPRRGKGNAVRHAFDAVDADVYLLVDGDGTYPAAAAPALIEALLETGAGMVVGTRLAAFGQGAFRRFHLAGNRALARLISWLFGVRVTDVFSGYRALSREFAQSVPLAASGFEIETEMTLQAVAKGFPIVELPIAYGARPEGSVSKLSTWSDGWLILKAIFTIFRDYKPLPFFWSLSLLLAMASAAAGSVPIADYYRTRLVEHLPLAVLATGLGVLAAILFGIGLILDTTRRYHDETFRLHRRMLGLLASGGISSWIGDDRSHSR